VTEVRDSIDSWVEAEEPQDYTIARVVAMATQPENIFISAVKAH